MGGLGYKMSHYSRIYVYDSKDICKLTTNSNLKWKSHQGSINLLFQKSTDVFYAHWLSSLQNSDASNLYLEGTQFESR